MQGEGDRWEGVGVEGELFSKCWVHCFWEGAS